MVTLTMEASIEKRKYKQLIAHIFSKHISSVFVSVKIGSDATKADLELLILILMITVMRHCEGFFPSSTYTTYYQGEVIVPCF